MATVRGPCRRTLHAVKDRGDVEPQHACRPRMDHSAEIDRAAFAGNVSGAHAVDKEHRVAFHAVDSQQNPLPCPLGRNVDGPLEPKIADVRELQRLETAMFLLDLLEPAGLGPIETERQRDVFPAVRYRRLSDGKSALHLPPVRQNRFASRIVGIRFPRRRDRRQASRQNRQTFATELPHGEPSLQRSGLGDAGWADGAGRTVGQ